MEDERVAWSQRVVVAMVKAHLECWVWALEVVLETCSSAWGSEGCRNSTYAREDVSDVLKEASCDQGCVLELAVACLALTEGRNYVKELQLDRFQLACPELQT